MQVGSTTQRGYHAVPAWAKQAVFMFAFACGVSTAAGITAAADSAARRTPRLKMRECLVNDDRIVCPLSSLDSAELRQR